MEMKNWSAQEGKKKAESAHLEDMERLKLDVLAPVLEQVHHDLQVLLVRDVPGHDLEVCPVEEDLTEKLQGLALRDVVRGLDKKGVVREELEGREEASVGGKKRREGKIERTWS
jgi:hypothetical protein